MKQIKTNIKITVSALAAIVLLVFALHPEKEKSETLVKLNASVTFNGEHFSVSNNDTIDYLNTEITLLFRLVLLHANCVKKPRRSFGYACVFCLVIAQNNFASSVQLIP